MGGITSAPSISVGAGLSGNGTVGNPVISVCRAWVNFNGTGTVAIRASSNISSITDNGVGDYTVNFATPMPDENYAITVGLSRQTTANAPRGLTIRENGTLPTINNARLEMVDTSSTGTTDMQYCHASFFR